MSDIGFYEVNKYYGENHILKGISFDIHEGEKVALLGKNGAGKTTIFKLISGEENADSGRVSVASGKKAGILDQIPVYPEAYTVLDVLKTAFSRQYELLREMQELEKVMESNMTDKILKNYGKLQNEYEALGGYSVDNELQRVCTGLKIDEDMQLKLFEVLSGGEKTRVNLAVIILKNTDILLLDEPTNHLDISSVEWLEDYLSGYKGTVVFISHDRYFIDNIAERIIEVVDGKADLYQGNYSYYVEEKEARYNEQLAHYNEEQKKIKQLEAAAKRMHEWAKNADNEAMHKRAFAIEKRIERMDTTDKPVKDKLLTGSFRENNFSGKEVVTLKNVTKAYDGKAVLEGVSACVIKNDRIVLSGENGCGKTTLLRMITGFEEPDEGEAKVGDSVKLSLLEQNISFENPEHTVIETIRRALIINEETARRILAAFHFKGKEVIKTVGTLSGGEKSRLKLCILMQEDTNVLILDEPTNHLDIQTREWIEEAVSSFNGTILFVSHDRYFINRFSNRVWELENGKLHDFNGTYAEYRAWKRQTELEKCQPQKAEKKIQEKSVQQEVRKATNIKKLELIEANISELEGKLKDIDDKMQQSSSNYADLNRLIDEKNKMNNELDILYKEWEHYS